MSLDTEFLDLKQCNSDVTFLPNKPQRIDLLLVLIITEVPRTVVDYIRKREPGVKMFVPGRLKRRRRHEATLEEGIHRIILPRT